MRSIFSIFVLLPAAIVAHPVSEPELVSRATQQCGQYQSQSSGPYTLATNGWGWATGKGSQCSEINSLTGNSLAWDTTWTWSGGPTSVKSYTNVQTYFQQKQLSAYTSIPTTWKWSYTGTNLSVNGMSHSVWLRMFAGEYDADA